MNESDVRKIVAPLAGFTSQGTNYGGHLELKDDILRGQTVVQVSHAAWIELKLWPKFKRTMEERPLLVEVDEEEFFSQLVKVAEPFYPELGVEAMATFWRDVVIGDTVRYGSNLDNAFKYGPEKFYDSVLDLAVICKKTNAFNGSEGFLKGHALRMGEVVRRFRYQDFQAYIDLADKLLSNGICDSGIEFAPYQWGEYLGQVIQVQGFRTVLEPLVDAQISLKDVPGSRDGKHFYSFLRWTIDDMLPALEMNGPGKNFARLVDEMLRPFVAFIRELHGKGVFRGYVMPGMPEAEVFKAFRQCNQMELIDGDIEGIMKKHIIPKWEDKLLSQVKR